MSEQTKLNMSLANIKSNVTLIENKKTEEINRFSSIRQDARFLQTSHTQIMLYCKNNKLFKGIYSIKRL